MDVSNPFQQVPTNFPSFALYIQKKRYFFVKDTFPFWAKTETVESWPSTSFSAVFSNIIQSISSPLRV